VNGCQILLSPITSWTFPIFIFPIGFGVAIQDIESMAAHLYVMSTGFDRVEYFALPMHRNFPKVMPAAVGTVGIQNYFHFRTANHALLFHAVNDPDTLISFWLQPNHIFQYYPYAEQKTRPRGPLSQFFKRFFLRQKVIF